MNMLITILGLLVGGWLITIVFNTLVDYIYFPKDKKGKG